MSYGPRASIVVAVVVATLLGGAAPARADYREATFLFLLVPVGSVHGYRVASAGLGWGLGASADVFVFDEPSVGVGVRIGAAADLLFYPVGSDDARFRQFDVLARVMCSYQASDTIQVYGSAEPGWSFVGTDGPDNPDGFIIVFAGGVKLAVSPLAFLTAEVGYRVGLQTVPGDYGPEHHDTQQLHVAVGFGGKL